MKSDQRVRIGKRIEQIRITAGITQEELAERVGTNEANISRIEKGKYNPGFDILQNIAEIFKMKIDFVKEDEDQKEKERNHNTSN